MWRPDLLLDSLSYLDSNVLIYAFEGPASSPQRRLLTMLFDQLTDGRTRACASVLVRAEVLVGPLRDGNAPKAQWYRQLLSGRGPVRLMMVTPAVADLAAKLRAERTALRLPDALHLAAALRVGCNYFVTGDRRLVGTATGPMRVLDLNELREAD